MESRFCAAAVLISTTAVLIISGVPPAARLTAIVVLPSIMSPSFAHSGAGRIFLENHNAEHQHMAEDRSGVVIVGGGIMGGDIAIIHAANCWDVHVMSPSAKTRDALPQRVMGRLKKLGAGAANASRVKTYSRLEDIPWMRVGMVVEAATEDLPLKQRLFAEVEALTEADVPIAS